MKSKYLTICDPDGSLEALIWTSDIGSGSTCIYLPKPIEDVEKIVSENLTDDVNNYEIQNIGDKVHYSHKHLRGSKSSFFAIEKCGGWGGKTRKQTVLTFNHKLDDVKDFLKYILGIDFSKSEPAEEYKPRNFKATQFLNEISLGKLESALRYPVPMPEEDKEVLAEVLNLADISEEKIKPYKIFYLIEPHSSSVGVSEPFNYEGSYGRRIRFPSLPLDIERMDKVWGLGFSIGCFYKKYDNETDFPNRSLSDYTLASYGQVQYLPDFDPKRRLKDDDIQKEKQHLTPVLNILSAVWNNPLGEKLGKVREIWKQDFGPEDLKKALKIARS